MRTCQSVNAGVEGDARADRRITKCLPRDRHHRRESILHPVFHLVGQKLFRLFGAPALRDLIL